MWFPESRRRKRLDDLLRERFRLDPDTPCAHQDHQGGTYCGGGPLRAEYAVLPSRGGNPDEPGNIVVLCENHHHLADMNRRSDAYRRDQDDAEPTWDDGPGAWMFR